MSSNRNRLKLITEYDPTRYEEFDRLYPTYKDRFKQFKIDLSVLADLDLIHDVKIDKSIRTEIDRGVYYTKNAVVTEIPSFLEVLPILVAHNDEVYRLGLPAFHRYYETYLKQNDSSSRLSNYKRLQASRTRITNYVTQSELKSYLQFVRVNLETDYLYGTRKGIVLAADFELYADSASHNRINTARSLTKKQSWKRYLSTVRNELEQKHFKRFNQLAISKQRLPVELFDYETEYGYLSKQDRSTWCRYVQYYELMPDTRIVRRRTTVCVNASNLIDKENVEELLVSSYDTAQNRDYLQLRKHIYKIQYEPNEYTRNRELTNLLNQLSDLLDEEQLTHAYALIRFRSNYPASVVLLQGKWLTTQSIVLDYILRHQDMFEYKPAQKGYQFYSDEFFDLDYLAHLNRLFKSWIYRNQQFISQHPQYEIVLFRYNNSNFDVLVDVNVIFDWLAKLDQNREHKPKPLFTRLYQFLVQLFDQYYREQAIRVEIDKKVA